MATINVKDATGNTVAIEKPLAPGQAAAAASRPVVLASDDLAVTALGAVADSAATQGSTGSISAKLRTVTAQLNAITSPGLTASVSQTRPSNTNTYGAGDVLGPTGGGTASMNFALGAISASNIMITSVALERDVAALISGETSYTLHLFNVTQPGAQVDEDTFTLASGDRASYLGNINLGTPVDLGATLYVEQNAVNKQVKLSGTGIFGVLVTVGSYVAASASVLKVTINAVQL